MFLFKLRGKRVTTCEWQVNEWINEWMRGLFSRLCHVFEVCVDGSYLSIWRGNHVVVDAFSQWAVTCRTNLSIKGPWTHKYHQRGVRAELQFPFFFLAFRIWDKSDCLRFGTTVVMDRLDLFAVVIISMCSDIQVASSWYVVYIWRKMFVYLLYVSME